MRIALLAVVVFVFGCYPDQVSVTGITPTLGVIRGGEKVAISGTGFTTEDMVSVYFGNYKVHHVAIAGSDSIRVATPIVPKPGKVDVRVVMGDGSEHLIKNGFEFVRHNRMAECVNISRALNGNPINP